MSLFDGSKLHAEVLAWPTLMVERVAAYAGESYPYCGAEAAKVRVVAGRVRGVLKRQRENSRFAPTSVSEKHGSVLDAFYLRRRTTRIVEDIISYRIGN